MNEQNRFVLANDTGYVFAYRNLVTSWMKTDVAGAHADQSRC